MVPQARWQSYWGVPGAWRGRRSWREKEKAVVRKVRARRRTFIMMGSFESESNLAFRSTYDQERDRKERRASRQA
jgi:hypothetical protein